MSRKLLVVIVSITVAVLLPSVLLGSSNSQSIKWSNASGSDWRSIRHAIGSNGYSFDNESSIVMWKIKPSAGAFFSSELFDADGVQFTQITFDTSNTTFFSENFDGVSPGTAITNPSLGWIIDDPGLAGVPVVKAGLHGWSGNAVYGRISGPSIAQYWYYRELALPTSGILQYEAKAYATSGGAGTHTSIGIGGGETYRMLRAGWRTQPNGWMFDIRPIAGWVDSNYQEIISSAYLNTTVTAKVIIDLNAKSIWGVLDNGSTSIETNHLSYTGDPDLGSVIYGPDYRNSWVGIDIDNVNVSNGGSQTTTGYNIVISYQTPQSIWSSYPLNMRWAHSHTYQVVQEFSFPNHLQRVGVKDLSTGESERSPWLPFCGPRWNTVSAASAAGFVHLRAYYAPVVIDDYEFLSGDRGTLVGSVTLKDFAGDTSLSPVRIELMRDGSLIESRVVSLGDANYYVLNGIPPGVYDVAFTACKWLRKVVRGVTVQPGGMGYCFVSLNNGDVDGDNAVTSIDLDVLLTNIDRVGDR